MKSRILELFDQLFESLATLTVRAAGQVQEAQTSHLRTQGGEKEVDLILERYDGAVLAFEVKLKPVPTDRDVANLHWLGKQLGNRFKGVLLNILLNILLNTLLSNMLSGGVAFWC